MSVYSTVTNFRLDELVQMVQDGISVSDKSDFKGFSMH